MGMAQPDIAAWYLTESPVVRRYLLALTGSPDLAEDLTQETFVQAMLALPGYRGGNVQAYLRGIARRGVRGRCGGSPGMVWSPVLGVVGRGRSPSRRISISTGGRAPPGPI